MLMKMLHPASTDGNTLYNPIVVLATIHPTHRLKFVAPGLELHQFVVDVFVPDVGQ